MTRTTTLWSLLLLSAALALGSCTKDATEQATGPEPEAKAASKLVFSSENAVRGELLVCFGEEAVAGIESSVMQVTRSGGVATRSGIADFDAVLGSIGVKALQRLFPVDERNEERTRAAGLHRWYVVEFDDAADLDKAALDMARIAEVSKVEFNQQLMHVHEGRVIPLAETGAAPQTRAAVGFNDPHLGKQWHYINTGDKSIYSKIKAGADVNCDEAWKLCTGDPRVIVAVVDNCVQWDHPDLAANMWTNTAELNGSEGRDDDSNGYADDIHGFNFVDNTTLTISTKGDAPDHGTHVAGTVGATNNNGIGVCGVAGGSGNNDGVRLMSCQALSGTAAGSGTTAVMARAFKYAADNGASIIQCSMGIKGGGYTSDDQYAKNAKAEHDALAYFIATSNCDAIDGGLVIFSAGNDALDRAGYPGAFRDYISVTSFSPDFLPASYTNYGPGCNISAPGGDAYIASNSTATVLSTMPSEMNEGSDYGYMQGTSMACPHVSGVAALGLSYAVAKGKHYTRNEFISMLLTSVNDMERYLDGTKESNGTMYLEKYRKQLGTGAVDAYQLLMQIEGTPCLKVGVGAEELIPLTQFFGGSATNLTYTDVSMSAADMAKLGIEAAPTMAYGKLKIKCTKSGVAKITVTAIGGGDKVGTGSVMGGMTITKEFAVIARGVQAGNGGWL